MPFAPTMHDGQSNKNGAFTKRRFSYHAAVRRGARPCETYMPQGKRLVSPFDS